ncbi:hypothetical protein NL323_30960, partial [Klebsiella pneumoniae]|nr:hypothetical protein [Klebsiella pneumoniae]
PGKYPGHCGFFHPFKAVVISERFLSMTLSKNQMHVCQMLKWMRIANMDLLFVLFKCHRLQMNVKL